MNGSILLAVDHSKVSHRAAELVADLAKKERDEVIVLHVHQVAIAPWGRQITEREPEQGCVAEQISEELAAAGVRVRPLTAGVNVGHVAVEIARVADREDAGLIVMGTHSDSDLASIALGSTSHRVLHLARRPILLVPAAEAEPGAPKPLRQRRKP